MKRIAIIAAGMALPGLVAALAAVPAAASGVQTIYAFDAARDGSLPYNLIAAPDNRVFGILNSGPTSGRAAVFELDPPAADAATWTERAIFTPPTKYGFLTKVLLDRSGNLFATALNYLGNGEWVGSLWQLTPSASATTGWTATLRASSPTAHGLRIAPFFLFYVNSTDVLYGGGYQYSPKTNPDDVGEIIQLAPYSADPTRDLASILAPSCTAADDPNADCVTVRSLVLGADHSFYGNTEAELFRLVHRVWWDGLDRRRILRLRNDLSGYPLSRLDGRTTQDIMPWVGQLLTRVGQSDLNFDPGRKGCAKLSERDLRLGLKDDIVGHACLAAPARVISPYVRQIQPIGDWQAGVIVGDRQVTATWQLSCLPSS